MKTMHQKIIYEKISHRRGWYFICNKLFSILYKEIYESIRNNLKEERVKNLTRLLQNWISKGYQHIKSYPQRNTN
jgi:hypothetical protein